MEGWQNKPRIDAFERELILEDGPLLMFPAMKPMPNAEILTLFC